MLHPWVAGGRRIARRRGNVELAVAAGHLEFVALQPSTFIIDSVSLIPSDAVRGLFRRDLFERLEQLRPGFVRMPGGNYLEGHGPRTFWNWKHTLGAPETRSGHYNRCVTFALAGPLRVG